MAKRPPRKTYETEETTLLSKWAGSITNTILPQASAETQTVYVSDTGIKTSFKASEADIRIITAMEKQKSNEKAQQNTKPNQVSSTMKIYDDGVEVTTKLQAQIEAQKARQQEQAQMVLDFHNRTTEQALREHIDNQLLLERTTETGTNFTQHVSEFGDQKFVNDYANNPQAIFQAQPRTKEELVSAGLAETVAEKMTVNYVGIDNPSDSISKSVVAQDTTVLAQGNDPLVFIPPENENENEPVANQEISQVNYDGQDPQGSTAREEVEIEKAKIEKSLHTNPILLGLLGLFILT